MVSFVSWLTPTRLAVTPAGIQWQPSSAGMARQQALQRVLPSARQELSQATHPLLAVLAVRFLKAKHLLVQPAAPLAQIQQSS